MTKKKILIISAIAIVILYVVYSFFSPSSDDKIYLTAKVIKGEFLSEVITSGEAQSINSIQINGPAKARQFYIYNIKIQDLVPEGTIVKKGDYIGKLDPSEVNSKISDNRINLENALSKFTQQQLDTTLSLKQERNAIKDLRFSLEETRLELKQSIYEPPASVKKLEIKLERSKRDLREKLENYKIKKRQANAKMIEVGTAVSKIQKNIDALIELQKEFTITSPDNGMVTYVKRGGSKMKVGSTISSWQPAIASLPDLTKMESRTYVNEVDIRKVKKGLPVKISFDAFPDVEMKGVVTSVANIGENKRGSNINVFQVLIKLKGSNKNIKPGMTTSNRILTYSKRDILMIPLESIFSRDSITFVYKKDGFSIKKQEITIGESNNDEVIVVSGLSENDEVYLNEPEEFHNSELASNNK